MSIDWSPNMKTTIAIFLTTVIHLSSGNLLGKVVWKENDKNTPVGKLSIIHSPHPVEFLPDAGSIPLEEISSIFSLALGFSVYKDLKWHGLLSGNPFMRPKALVTFTVGDLPSGESINLRETVSFPVVRGEASSSMADLMSLGPHHSLANHIASSFNDQSLTVSVAADEEVASCGHSQSENRATAFLDKRDETWRYFSGAGTFEISGEKLKKVINGDGELDNIRISIHDKKVSVKTLLGTTVFDTTKPEVKNFFDEVATIMWMSQKAMKKPSLLTDGYTDVYSFFITTLKGIGQVYGSQSSHMKGAVKVVEALIEKISKSYKKAYNGNVLIGSVQLNEEKSVYSDDEVENVYQQLKSKVEGLSFSKFHHDFPSLHLLRDVEEQARSTLCKNVKGVLSSISGDIKFKCASKHEKIRYLNRRSLLEAKDAAKETDNMNLASYYDPDFPVIFNIWFWLLVILALSMYIISLVMWFMDPGKDSIIYRMTSQRIKTD